MAKINEAAEPVGSVPKDSERLETPLAVSEPGPGRVKKLEEEVMDLKITNRAKDYFIDQLQKEREGFAQELVIRRKTRQRQSKSGGIGKPAVAVGAARGGSRINSVVNLDSWPVWNVILEAVR